eukprot:TRINITY_DN9358_c0_g1_i1.p1 TRINITY_DN9358_c0_g1~~TRINITY_DN9358_c0_g1_i1.p1  ORF type:complete len:410 (-),score=67.63 TRINITY_DN9358_c0_g1_i1:322-1551(-)
MSLSGKLPVVITSDSYSETPLSRSNSFAEGAGSPFDVYSSDDSENYDVEDSINITSFGDDDNKVNDFGLRSMRKYSDQDPSSPEFATHKKHIFILTSSGRPIYSRYGDENKLAGFMGLLVGLVSIPSYSEDNIKAVIAGNLKIVFSIYGPIYMVIVSKTTETVEVLRSQLEYMHSQIISFLTISAHQLLIDKPRFDLRNLLNGTDSFMDRLASQINRKPTYLLNCVNCMRLNGSVRNVIGNIIQSERGSRSLFFALLLAKGKLVQLVRPKKHILYPTDIHLITNYINCIDQLEIGEEAMAPICLPKFNNNGFLHQYLSYINDDVCLLLLSARADDFFDLSDTRDRIVKSLKESDCMRKLNNWMQKENYSVDDIGIQGLLHFIYKSHTTSQMTSPVLGPPYSISNTQKKR